MLKESPPKHNGKDSPDYLRSERDNQSEVQEDVNAILSSAIKASEDAPDTSFYSNGLDAIEQSSAISNRQRLNEPKPDSRPHEIGVHLENNFFKAPADHLIQNALKQQHERTKSKANADLADELDIGVSVKLKSEIYGFRDTKQ